ncbi:SDR family oxidoreductase [Roseofilum sp. BLCC_M91]|uniref:SDR family oxidoreductase n=1 Tax=Roseofilum halophilum BLCC-M91 TaxID=3022259 RepID=A0ABT7BQG1_9CYAN|nr:SDR family oxidoreductase [Roseofilum halophilum]MDJ1180967.1 SDR family oxidoreductase [Roseofilum halophilum BLCC-M91]
MKIAIIGCGYVGSACSRYWLDRGHQVTVTTTTPERVQDLQAIAHQVRVVQGSDRSQLQSIIQDQDVILLSVGAKRTHRTPEGYRDTYLGTAQTLVSALETAPQVRQIIYTSSYQVYGDRQGNSADETTPVAPVSENGEILAQTERVLLSAQTPDRQVCILRLGGIYGPNRELIKIYRTLAGTARPGTGQEATNWIHLEDIVGAIAHSCEKTLDGIYNLVDDAHLTRQTLLDRLLSLHQYPAVTWDASLPDPRPYNVWVSNQKIKETGYQFQYGDRQLN